MEKAGKRKLNKKEEPKEVAALYYSPDENESPKILALGKGETAEKILEIAQANEVPVYRDPELAHTLNQLKIGDEIPPELFEVVAEVLVFISSIDKSYGERKGIKEDK